MFAHAEARGLKGTILLAEEGINLFLAGSADAVRGFVAQLQQDSRFADVGFVPYKLIKGKAVLVFWPLSAFKTLP